MEKHYQIFISSTFRDLEKERQATLKAILALDHMPAGMELFPASDREAWGLICDVIDASDYYILIIGGKYGSLNEEGISFTENEYKYAILKEKPVLALLHANPNNLPRDKTEVNDLSWKKLKAFRSIIEEKHTCVYWSTIDELKSQVILSLTSAFKRQPRVGWVRADTLASNEAGQKIIKLQEIVNEQKTEIERLSITAPSGMEDLAQGNDKIDIKFKLTFSKNDSEWNAPDRNIREEFIVTTTWDNLYKALAPHLLEGCRDTKMKSTVTRYLKESAAVDLPDYQLQTATLSETVFQSLRTQFIALGLIECRSEIRMIEGKEKDLTICELTAYGRNYLFKINSIRKNI